MDGDDLARAAAALEGLDHVPALWDTVLAALRPLGIEHAIYLTAAPGPSDPYLLTTMPALHAGIDPAHDPFLEHCCRDYGITLTGVAFLSDHVHALTPEAAAFIRRAARGGFRSGLGVPVRPVGSPRHGGFNLGTGLDRAAFEARILPRADALRSFCLIAHRRLEEAASTSALGTLTPREREVALLLAEGRSRKECARLCGLSPHTVSDHAKAAYRKLGVRDRLGLARRLRG